MAQSVLEPLTDHWEPFNFHRVQADLWESSARFRVVPAGRRSGKTAVAKRFLVLQAMLFEYPQGRFICAAPTYAQAREIFWDDIQALIPREWIYKTNETRMHIWLINGVKIMVVGLDKSQRIEGKHLDGIIIDEIADCKPDAWPRNIRPMLSTAGRPPGWAWFIGVPEGFDHFHELYEKGLDDSPKNADWASFTWPSDGVIDPSELLAAQDDLDELEYAQEYGGVFRSKEGRAFHQFKRDVHAKGRLQYNPKLPLYLCFDFNREPGVCAVAQIQDTPLWMPKHLVGKLPNHPGKMVCFIDEVYIERDSNTYKVCDVIIGKYGEEHESVVYGFGDASGGNGGTAKVKGSDWDLIAEKFADIFEYYERVPKGNPPVISRLNAANRLFCNAAGQIRIAIDKRCKYTIASFDSTQCDRDGNVLKPKGEKHTHIGEGASYMLEKEWPVKKGRGFRQKKAAS